MDLGRILAAILLLAGCVGEVPTSTEFGLGCDPNEAVGDLDEPIELSMVVQTAEGETALLTDGASVTLVNPPQGGEVLVIGTRARNLVPSGVQVSGFLFDPDSNARYGLEERPADLVETTDGWAEPETPTSIANYAHVAACPSANLTRNIFDERWALILKVEDCRGETAQTSLTVMPRCAPGDDACLCQCSAGYTPGGTCDGGTPPPPPPTGNCVTAAAAGPTRLNRSIPAQTGAFTFEVDVTPDSATMDSAVALSSGQTTEWAELAAIVQFRPDGEIAVRDGAGYLLTGVTYVAGTKYSLRYVADVPGGTYSVTLKGPDGVEKTLGTALAFRVPVTQLDTFAVFSDAGVMLACDFGLP